MKKDKVGNNDKMTKTGKKIQRKKWENDKK